MRLAAITCGAVRVGALVLTIACLSAASAVPAHAESVPLLLDVSINGKARNLVGNFVRDDAGQIAAASRELAEIGLNPPAGKSDEDLVLLRDLQGVTYEYDEAAQAISIVAPAEARVAQSFDIFAPAENAAPEKPKVERNLGALLNYTLFASGAQDLPRGTATYSGTSASLDARFFSGLGTLSQTGMVGDRMAQRGGAALRLDTSWIFSDPDSAVVYRAGDQISGGLSWTRPIRLGGVQVQRNFALRGDLVTLPLPTVSGTAAVPSSIDVYVNNARTFTKDVEAGPFQIHNLPLVTGAGQARIVVRDASGRQTESTLPFFVSAQLLKPGLFDFSVEGGFARLDYGQKSFSYDKRPVASGSLRYGMTDWLTLQAHAEGTYGFGMAGAGIDMRLFGLGVATIAGSASAGRGGPGYQFYANVSLQWGRFVISASTQRSFGNYLDLAAVTAPPRVSGSLAAAAQAASLAGFDFGSARPAHALDRVSLSVPLPYDLASVNFTLAQVVDGGGRRVRLASASASRSVFKQGTVFINGFVDLDDHSRMGIFAGYSMPLGPGISSTVSASRDGAGWSYGAQASKGLGTHSGDYGWRVTDQEGPSPTRAASISYRAPFAEVEAGANQSGGSVSGAVTVSGSVAAASSDVFFASRIPDAFAVVDAGMPGVKVELDSRPVGSTGKSGKMLVTGLRSFQKNTLSLDAASLPLNAQVQSTSEQAVPADGGVVVVSFGGRDSVPAAIVRLVGQDGQPLPAGFSGRLNDAEDFVVGYGGQAYIAGLASTNRVVVRLAKESCEAQFDFRPDADGQVTIGPVTCIPLATTLADGSEQ